MLWLIYIAGLEFELGLRLGLLYYVFPIGLDLDSDPLIEI